MNSPSARVLASLATCTGTPRLSVEVAPRAAGRTSPGSAPGRRCPSRSMTPGDAMPTPMTGRVAAASRSRHRFSSRSAAAWPVRPSRATERRSTTAPTSVITAPSRCVSSVRSTATIWNASVRIPTSVAGLPTFPSTRTPSSSTSPSAIRAATRPDTVTRVRPVLRAMSAREAWPMWNRWASTSERLCARACSGSTLPVGRRARPTPWAAARGCVVAVTFVSRPSLQIEVNSRL